jgi:hypothetical protein
MAHAISRKPEFEAMVDTVRREFDEMPGLALTAQQAQRLWALEPRMCTTVLRQLVHAGYLCENEGGRFAKPSAA